MALYRYAVSQSSHVVQSTECRKIAPRVSMGHMLTEINLIR